MTDLTGKTVLVTAAAQGIGRATALAFARSGATVHATDVNLDKLNELASEANITTGKLDVLSDETVKAFVGKVGTVDVLANCAGFVHAGSILEMKDEDFDFAMNLNVRSLITVSQAAVPHIEARGGGAIINVGSIAGNDGGGPGSGHYAAAKAYVHNMTRHMARDLAKRNIRVNAIAPGVIETAFHAQTPPDRMEAMKNATQLGRVGTPEDCVGPLLFFAKGSESGYVTGQILHVNGGQYMP